MKQNDNGLKFIFVFAAPISFHKHDGHAKPVILVSSIVDNRCEIEGEGEMNEMRA